MNAVTHKLSIFALGGVNEIGKNMYVIQFQDDIIVIDCGSKFPDESLLGIDLIIPDISYLLENKDKVRALIITHGHEDHIGGVAYILKQLNMPIYATRLTLGLIEGKLREAGLLAEAKLIEINSDSRVELGSMTSTFFRTNHSIPDCLGIAFQTPEGTVVHTGDFKFDLTPVNEQYPDIHKMAEIGKNGVLALLSESTNAERPGFTPSERVVGEHIEDAFIKAKQKVFISTFASNVHRLQQVVDAAILTNRKLALLGRSMVNVVKIASGLGYLHIPEGMLVEASEISRMASDRIAILCTGSQGEPMAALSRLASSTFRHAEIASGDTVILSASPIPGNERNVSRIVDNLFRLGAKVIYGSGSVTGMHVSGHASQEELKLMLTLMKPQYFIPIHGEFRMLHQHSLLAESVGVERNNIFIINIGDVVDIENQVASQNRKVAAGNTFVIGGIGMFILFGFLFYLSSILEGRHLIVGIWKGLMLAIPLVAVCLLSYLTGKLVGKNKQLMKWLTFTGLIIVTIAMLACGWLQVEALFPLISLLFMTGFGIGIVLPCLDAMVTEGIDKEQRGTITSLYSSMRFIGVAAGPPITSLLLGKEAAMFFTFAAIAGLAGLFTLFAIKPKTVG